jgi:hypothetical protein
MTPASLSPTRLVIHVLRHRWPILLLLALLTVLQVIRAIEVSRQQPTDILIFYDASMRSWHGGDPYQAVSERMLYYYSPLLTWAFRPFIELSYPAVVGLWALLSSVAWICAVMLVVELSWEGPRPVPNCAVLGVVLLSYRFVLNHLLHGQVDLFILLALTLCCGALVRQRHTLAGMLLAFTIVLKMLPILFLGYLALRRSWKALGWSLVGIGLFFLLPVLGYGTERFSGLLQMWWAGPFRSEAISIASDAQESNQSLAATLYRYCLPKPLQPPEDAAPALLKLTELQVLLLVATVSVILVVVVARFLLRQPQRPYTDMLGFALTFVVTHLVVKRSWGYHFVSMVFVYAALVGACAHPGLKSVNRLRLIIGIGAVGFLQNFYSPLLVGKRLSSVISSYGPITASLLILIVILRQTFVWLDNDEASSKLVSSDAKTE